MNFQGVLVFLLD